MVEPSDYEQVRKPISQLKPYCNLETKAFKIQFREAKGYIVFPLIFVLRRHSKQQRKKAVRCHCSPPYLLVPAVYLLQGLIKSTVPKLQQIYRSLYIYSLLNMGRYKNIIKCQD